MRSFNSLIASFLIGSIRAIRPLLLGPAVCYFSPSCAEFACTCLKEKSLSVALPLIIKRILSCNSFTFR